MVNPKEKRIVSQQKLDNQKKRPKVAQDTIEDQAGYCALALLLGPVGIHNLSIGRWKQGLAQMLLLPIFFGGWSW